jgi:glycine/D-amino acid oxidase-like deaminating enzyme/nitrite reductase/ring-hydroxylating ferredoxin subunit
LRERNISLWVATTPETQYPQPAEDVTVDVAVIGAGITGLSTAILLKRAGVRVAVIEAGRVASGVTGYTTAKITSLHGLVYAHLVEQVGEERARIYADANQAAIEQVAAFVEEYGLNCDFRRAAAYTYTEDPARVEDLRAEVEASQGLGLPASYTETTDLPYPVRAAVRFDNQALFHPRKYCLALARLIPGDGSHVFEMTRAMDLEEGSPCGVITGHGTIRAQHVVLATQIPFMDRGGFFAKTSPSRAYALGVRVEGVVPEGMYLGVDSPTRSIRPHPVGDETVLIIGGEGHKVGQDEDTRRRYAALEEWSRERFHVRSMDYRWSAQDYMPVDGVPYIGRLTSGSERIYVATGFRKWGMTTGTFAGFIISDAILGRDNPWSSLFDATRVDLTRSAKRFVTENTSVAKRFLGDRIGIPEASDLMGLAPGEGKVAEVDGEKVAAYRDEAGAVHTVSPICGHMGCVVSWNSAERTWDCPCHGSRYDYDGHAIQGPTVRDLEPKEMGVPAPTEAAAAHRGRRERGTNMSGKSDQNSNPVRAALRSSAVYSVAGILAAGDAVSAAARGIGRGVQQASAPTPDMGDAPGTRPEGGGKDVGGVLRSGVVHGLARIMVAGRSVRRAGAGVLQDATERSKAIEAPVPVTDAVASTDAPPQEDARDD